MYIHFEYINYNMTKKNTSLFENYWKTGWVKLSLATGLPTLFSHLLVHTKTLFLHSVPTSDHSRLSVAPPTAFTADAAASTASAEAAAAAAAAPAPATPPPINASPAILWVSASSEPKAPACGCDGTADESARRSPLLAEVTFAFSAATRHRQRRPSSVMMRDHSHSK